MSMKKFLTNSSSADGFDNLWHDAAVEISSILFKDLKEEVLKVGNAISPQRCEEAFNTVMTARITENGASSGSKLAILVFPTPSPCQPQIHSPQRGYAWLSS